MWTCWLSECFYQDAQGGRVLQVGLSWNCQTVGSMSERKPIMLMSTLWYGKTSGSMGMSPVSFFHFNSSSHYQGKLYFLDQWVCVEASHPTWRGLILFWRDIQAIDKLKMRIEKEKLYISLKVIWYCHLWEGRLGSWTSQYLCLGHTILILGWSTFCGGHEDAWWGNQILVKWKQGWDS